jgi:hypothetical protein
MLKNLIVTLGIAALTSGSAFAAAKAKTPKAATHVTHKVAQAQAAAPSEAKAKNEKADKAKAKKVKAAKPQAKAEGSETKPAKAEPAAPAMKK